jgi:hypothetical protein
MRNLSETARLLLDVCAHRRGAYAEAYRAGVRDAGRERPRAAQCSQGYRDGRALRPYRIRKQGAGRARAAAARRYKKALALVAIFGGVLE